MFLDRTIGAMRILRHADGRTQFHHGLVEITGADVGELGLRRSPALFQAKRLSAHSAKHSFDVAVHDGNRFIKSDAGDSGCCIAANSRQVREFARGTRESAGVMLHDLARSLMHHARTAVITETAPRSQD